MTKLHYLKNYCYLTEREAKILSLKDIGYSNTKIASDLKISNDRVRQLYNAATHKIKKYGVVKISFYKVLSVETLQIHENVKNTLIESGLYTIPDVFITYKNGRLGYVKGLGESGINEILKQLHDRELIMIRGCDNFYTANDLTEIECRLYILYMAKISIKEIRKEIFNDNVSLYNVKKMINEAREKCRIHTCCNGDIKQLVLPPKMEKVLVKEFDIQCTNTLINKINDGSIYDIFSYNEVSIIYKALDRYGCQYFRNNKGVES